MKFLLEVSWATLLVQVLIADEHDVRHPGLPRALQELALEAKSLRFVDEAIEVWLKEEGKVFV